MSFKAESVLHYFYRHEAERGDLPFLKQPFGDRWEVYTWAEAGQMARKLANYLHSLDLKPGSHIGLVSKNCREWVIADLAIMMAGHVSVPFFATLTGKQIAEVLELGDVDLLFVGKLEVWDDMKTGVPEDMPIIRFPHYEGNSKVARGKAWEAIMEESPPLVNNHYPLPDDLWTIIFTSGTTGTPKGVMIKYKTIDEGAVAIHETNPLAMDQTGGNNQFFSFLPLNHIAERGVVETMCLRYGGSIAFTESIDRFAQNLKDIRPTLFFAVPRIWTKLRLGLINKLGQKRIDVLLKIPIVSSLLKKVIKKGLGLDRSRCNITGAAPIPQATKDWFAKVDIGISEAYGMTENCATSHMLSASEHKPGSVGRAQAGTEHKIDPENQEILTRSVNTMDGYYKDPEKTAETVDAEGWLHTGDQGHIDEDGYLYITGRVKDTFKTAKAKFIVPNAIEEKFASSENIENLVLLGLGMPQPILLIELSEIAKAKPTEALHRELESQLAEVNAELSSYKKVAATVIVKEGFSIENGTLTPTLKIKRPQVHQRYRDQLLDWIERGEKVIAA